MSEWDDLGDDELESRLVQRGLPRADARSWVDYRDVLAGRRQITEFLKDQSDE